MEKSFYLFVTGLEKKYAARQALWMRRDSGWSSLRYQELVDQSFRAAEGLRLLGLQHGDKVLILAKSNPLFAVSLFATGLNGATTIPLDTRMTVPELVQLAAFSEASHIITLDDESQPLAQQIAAKVPELQTVSIRSLLESPRTLARESFAHSALRENDLMFIAFTSGTTSSPKGVMLTWGNILYDVDAVASGFGKPDGTRFLSILPLNHMLEISGGLLLPLLLGGEIFYVNSMMPHQIIEAMRDHKITDLLTVPLFLKALKKGIESEIRGSHLKKIYFCAALFIATLLPFEKIRRFVFAPIHKKFGGHLTRIIHGAALLDARTSKFFELLGLNLFEGYGLTETSPMTCVNFPGQKRAGTVGRPLPGVETRLHPLTGELLVRGPNVMQGYYKNPKATAECLDEKGWLNTGDTAHISDDGFVRIIGRNKDIIVLENGKKVVPDEVEDFFAGIQQVQELSIVGAPMLDQKESRADVVTMVIVPNKTELRSLSENETEAREKLVALLKRRALDLSYYKRPTQYVFHDASLPRTTTLKLKRNQVQKLITKNA